MKKELKGDKIVYTILFKAADDNEIKTNNPNSGFPVKTWKKQIPYVFIELIFNWWLGNKILTCIVQQTDNTSKVATTDN